MKRPQPRRGRAPRWWEVALAALVAFAIIWGVNVVQAGGEGPAEAERQAPIAAAEHGEIDALIEALVVKFSNPSVLAAEKAAPPAEVVEEPVADEPVYDEPVYEEPVYDEPVYEEGPSTPGPVLCPLGSRANSSDGYNDTSCLPEVCFTISVLPDPDHPECDVAFEP